MTTMEAIFFPLWQAFSLLGYVQNQLALIQKGTALLFSTLVTLMQKKASPLIYCSISQSRDRL